MSLPKPVAPELLRRPCPPSTFAFETTESLEPLAAVPGQQRAFEALEFGLAVDRDGFNLFAVGSPEMSPESVVAQFLDRASCQKTSEQIQDWVYVNNFQDERRPNAISLPRGLGKEFRDSMDQLIEDLASAIPAAFESDEYRSRVQELQNSFSDEEQEPFEALRKHAEEKNIAVLKTPRGISLAPTTDGGEVMDPEAFENLPEEKKQEIHDTIEELQTEVEDFVQQIPKWRRMFQRRLKELNRQVTQNAVRVLIDEVRVRYAGEPEIAAFLDEVREDVLDNAHVFQLHAQQGESPFPMPIPIMQTGDDDGDPFVPYRVNVLVDHSETECAPVVHEENPTFANLVGRIEHLSEMGTLSTDFTLIQAGALHRANGGFLMLDARSVLMEPFAWEGLKRALKAGRVRIESLGQAYSLVSSVTLEPEPIPLDIKIVLIGERMLYYLLSMFDPDFSKLFRVAADFDDEMPRDEANDQLYARLIASVAAREQLLPFTANGVARVIEEASRQAQNSGKLTLEFDSLQQLLEEADHWAQTAGAESISAADVETAIERRRHRSGRLREKALEHITEGTVLIDTGGEAVGQVNGLSVLSLGDATFGQPSRITARTRPGSGGVIDIEREAKLGGKLHSKGVLILTGYLAGKFRQDGKLSVSASLVLEQSYGGVDGDSASSAELYALLSSLSGVPIKQCFAVTGSVNQHGRVQAIGGANEKIEGFFEVCEKRELTGQQGVLIPESNVKHLMLRREVAEACAAGRFHVYPVRTIEEGIELLTGVSAEEIFAKIETTLERFAKAAEPEKEDNRKEEDGVEEWSPDPETPQP